jgi:hypothetical protein
MPSDTSRIEGRGLVRSGTTGSGHVEPMASMALHVLLISRRDLPEKGRIVDT